MNIYDDQTDLVLDSWAAQRRRDRLAFWGLMAVFVAVMALGVIAYHAIG